MAEKIVVDKNLLQAFSNAIDQTKQIVSHVNDSVIEIARLDERVSVNKEDIIKLFKLLVDGNGEPPLTKTIIELSKDIKVHIQKDDDMLAKLFHEVASIKDTQQELERKRLNAEINNERERRKAKQMYVVAIIAFCATIASAVLPALVK